ncbi:hypothetical protein K470DRAFT_258910, partial [Piedraia hortae CBS 480.64]
MSNSNPQINVLLTTLPGLSLPRTLSLHFDSSTSVSCVLNRIYTLLPPSTWPSIAVATTSRGLPLPLHRNISDILPSGRGPITLHLTSRLPGGKGGFGSQLRAAGGRMSSRKKNRRGNDEDINGSNRNLDGRRLRTVNEAKKLAEYLIEQPEAERKEKENKKRKWEALVDLAEKKEREIQEASAKRGKLDEDFVERKRSAEERTKQAVVDALRNHVGMEKKDVVGAKTEANFFGWDDLDEDDSSDDDDDVSSESSMLEESSDESSLSGEEEEESSLSSEDEEEERQTVAKS